MTKVEKVSLRIFGRDLTLACPPKEKENLIKAANLLNDELNNISDKNNALIIAGLNLANKSLKGNSTSKNDSDVSFKKLLSKIEDALEK